MEMTVWLITRRPPTLSSTATPTEPTPEMLTAPLTVTAPPTVFVVWTPKLRSPVTDTEPLDWSWPSMADSTEMPAESLPCTVIEPPVVAIEPWKGWAPVTWMPNRFEPLAKTPSSMPSPLVSVAV